MNIPNDVLPAEILDIFKDASLQYFVLGKPKVSFRNDKTIEIGNWRKSNTAGYKAKAVISKNKLRFTIKGTNVYYSKLPVFHPGYYDSFGKRLPILAKPNIDPLDRELMKNPIEYTANKILLTIKSRIMK